MNELRVFNNPEFGQVRMVEFDGKPFAVGNDVANALEYARPHEAVTAHCKGAVSYSLPTNGGVQAVKAIPEGDIYRLIVKAADQSRNLDIKAKAERFERWIFDEILPQIRKTGSYAVKPPTHTEALLQAVQLLAEQERKLNHQQEQITVINHRINNLDSIDTTGDRRHVLAKMAQRLAHDKGVSFPAAWHLFDDAFNTAYRTNLTARRNNYAKRARIKDIGRPEYLEAVGQVEDGIRVMDKLLNGFAR